MQPLPRAPPLLLLPLLVLLLLHAAAAQLPPWPPTWSMSASTFVMPADVNGNWDYAAFSLARFGIVSFDQSSNKRAWVNGRPMDVEDTMLMQARLAKAANPAQHVWIYRQSVFMIPYLASVRAVLADEAFSPWFIPYAANVSTFVNPPCDDNFSPPLCSKLFHSQYGMPGFPHGTPIGYNGTSDCPAPACDCGIVPCGQYLLDYRRWTDTPVRGTTMKDWFIRAYTLEALQADGGGLVDGLFFDDAWTALEGPSEVGKCRRPHNNHAHAAAHSPPAHSPAHLQPSL